MFIERARRLRRLVVDGHAAQFKGSDSKIVASLTACGPMQAHDIMFVAGLERGVLFLALRRLRAAGFVVARSGHDKRSHRDVSLYELAPPARWKKNKRKESL